MATNKAPGRWPCDQCSKRLRSRKGVEDHKKAVHGHSASGYSKGWSSFTVPAELNAFLNDCRPGDVNRYISQHLQTDESFRDECSDVVDRVASFFKRSSLFTVTRFIKGGSLGKGTAIKSKSDIDCVMFISELPSIDNHDYNRQLQGYLEQMKGALVRSKNSIAYNLEVLGRTSHAVKLRVKTQKRGHESHDVDLLLATDILGHYPTFGTKTEVYAAMGKMDARSKENCSASLVELQVAFVKKQSAEVKDLIRLVKMWKKSCVWEPSLTSYPLELLCIHTWRSHMSVADAFKAVLEQLSDYRNIEASWAENYSTARKQFLGQRPLILDPANPYNNVANRCERWSVVAEAARETLRKPFFSRY
ncbi:2'-5'-oligoadenylate synthase-like protein 2 [Branchiostoma floridae x Branchiostoma japonicum]